MERLEEAGLTLSTFLPDLLILEVLPKLDLASMLSLSLTSASLNRLLAREDSPLLVHRRRNDLEHPVVAVVKAAIRGRHDALFDFFLPYIKAALRSLNETEFTSVVGEALVSDRLDLFESLPKTIGRDNNGTTSRENRDDLLECAGESGNIKLIEEVSARYEVKDVERLSMGAARGGHLHVYKWMQESNLYKAHVRLEAAGPFFMTYLGASGTFPSIS